MTIYTIIDDPYAAVTWALTINTTSPIYRTGTIKAMPDEKVKERSECNLLS